MVDRPRRPDHPRSRGVYVAKAVADAAPAGSSPLARGLRRRRARRRSWSGIIPARAGFTQRRRGLRVGARDHPRSRGVYVSAVLGPLRARGSSPLARGLPHQIAAVGGGGGIIPARAGFTIRRLTLRYSLVDHPRSRGVYPRKEYSTTVPRGSSPLARGLLVGLGEDRIGVRIIPARAGFTRGGPGPGRFAADHPRSRGVYAHLAPRCFETSVDHPRSRGVYDGVALQAALSAGSSPLARGLRGPARPRCVHHGIIPARAGFTSLLGC